MQLGPRFRSEYRTLGQMNYPRSAIWAGLLCIGYVLGELFDFLMIRFTLGEDGRWVVTTLDEPEKWMAWLFLGNSAFSLCFLCLFLWMLVGDIRRNDLPISYKVSGWDMFYVLAWLQALHTILLFLYWLVLPYPLFAQGTFGSMVESASMQVFILLVALFWFWGRADALGFQRPKHIGKMVISLVAIFVFIAVALDALLTTPIADSLNLSLESEREQAIGEEIESAKENNWLMVVASVLMIGVFVPIAEEVLFRGVIQTYLVQRLGAWWGILLASLWFALIHVDLALFVPLFTIGLGLGFIRHRFETIWGAIILHAINNTFSVLASL